MDSSLYPPPDTLVVGPSRRYLEEATLAANAKFFEHELLKPGHDGSNQIRLLKLVALADAGIRDGNQESLTPFHGWLEEYNLRSSELPSYIALSYAWGLGTDRSYIRLRLPESSTVPTRSYEDERFFVTRTLKEALHELLVAVNSTEPIYVWADAICINQGSYQERSFQVQLMSEIYSRATEVCIWLGMSYRGDSLHGLANETVLRTVNGEELKISSIDLPRQSNAEESWWWNRLWVVQEIYFAKSCPTILRWCSRFSWDDFYVAWHHLEEDRPDGALLAFGRLYNFRTDYEDNPDKRLRLLDLLHWTSGLQSSDAHDTIYAVLGMARSNDRNAIVPDYGAPVADLYGTVTRYLLESLEENNPLDLLAFFPRFADRTAPSWIRDFSRSCNRAYDLFDGKSVFDIKDKPLRLAWDQHTIATTKDTFVMKACFLNWNAQIFSACGEEIATVRKSAVMPHRSGSEEGSNKTATWARFIKSFCKTEEERLAVLNLEVNLGREFLIACHTSTFFITYSGLAGFCYYSSFEDGIETAGLLEKGDKIVVLRGASIPFVLRPYIKSDPHWAGINPYWSKILGPCRLSSQGCQCRNESPHRCLTRFHIL